MPETTVSEDTPGMAAERDAMFIRAREWAELSGANEARAIAAESRLAELEKHSERIEVAYLDADSRAEKAESQLTEERELRMSLESSWQQAEAQLAELRGSLSKLAGEFDNTGSYAGWGVAKHLRTLAEETGLNMMEADDI